SGTILSRRRHARRGVLGRILARNPASILRRSCLTLALSAALLGGCGGGTPAPFLTLDANQPLVVGHRGA
ncbi:MAG TPA: hypothetical protein PK359_16810, partial [Burkholderiaceae bacterium]|nr:hypothetical protein [Burkholderiaceae bacterium]